MKNRVQSSGSLQALRIFYFKSSARAVACVGLSLLVTMLSGEVSSASEVSSRTFMDDLNRQVVVSQVPQRIISLAPSITEILFAIGAGNQVVGVTQFCDYPLDAQTKPKVGYINANLELIVALQPDIVLAPREILRADVLSKLEQLQIPTFTFDAQTIEHVFGHIKVLGRMLEKSSTADELAAQMSGQIKQIQDQIALESRPGILYVLSTEPLITVGPGSFIHQLINLAGGRNVAGDASVPYPRLSMETVLKEDPELIIFPTRARDGLSEEELQRWQRWTTLSAVKYGGLHRVQGDLLNRPGPRIVIGLEMLARLMHPKAFADRSGR